MSFWVVNLITALLSFVIAGVSGIFLVPFLHKIKFGQPIKTVDGPKWHEKKQGTAQEKTEKAVKDHEKKSFKEATTRFLNSEAYCGVVTAISILLFDFLLPRVGYIWTGCICSILLLVAFRSKKWYHYLIVIAFTFFLSFLFSKVLLVKMP